MNIVRKNILLFALGLSAAAFSQSISIKKIYTGTYHSNAPVVFKILDKGNSYLKKDAEGLSEYTISDNKRKSVPLKGNFSHLELSKDAGYALLFTDMQPVYRHSYTAKVSWRELKSGTEKAVFQGKPIMIPSLSPDGHRVAFVYENNLYIEDMRTGALTQITNDGEKNSIINGLADWVYEEEFGHAKQYAWSEDGKILAFVKTNEKEVPEISLPIYEAGLYPGSLTYKYPKAGEKNADVALYIYQTDTGKTVQADLSGFKKYYIPKVQAGTTPQSFLVLTSERKQNAVDVLSVNHFGKAKLLFTETDPAWIETDSFILDTLPDGSFVWSSERDGHRHLYLYTADGKLKKQLTKGDWEVTDYYGMKPDGSALFIQSTQNGSTRRAVSRIDMRSGKSAILSRTDGTAAAQFSDDYSVFIEKYTSSAEPGIYTLKDGAGKTLKVLEDNSELKQKLKTDGYIQRTFLQIPGADGTPLNAWMLKPKNFDPNKKYPVFMFQYSGPGSQQVDDAYDSVNSLWFSMLANKGYIVVCADGRGTGYRGRDFKKTTYLQLGKKETEDQIAVAKWLGKQSYTDAERIGIFGWSFGGYLTSLALTKAPEVFRIGIAVAPVTNWRYYDTIYTERFLDTPQNNPAGYDENSPVNFASRLKGKFLLIHGTADDNVHFQNSMALAEALIQQNKQFGFMAYPDKNHGIYGGYTRIQLFDLMTKFIEENL